MTSDPDNQTTRIIQRAGPKGLPGRPETTKLPESPPAKPAVAAPVAAPAAPPPVPVAPVVTPPMVAAPVAARPVAAQEPVVAKPKPSLTPPLKVAPKPVAEPAAVAPKPVAPPVPPPAPEHDVLVTARITPTTSDRAAAPVAAERPAIPVVSPFVAAKVARFDPVVGWVVIVKGPGRGQACELRSGRNAIGTAAGQAIRLEFGDPAIAAQGHAYLVYDDEERSFVIEDGKQKELVRLNGHLLSETRPLAHGDHIRIGATTLRFIALCGPDFDWREPEAPASPVADAGPVAEAAPEAETAKPPATPLP